MHFSRILKKLLTFKHVGKSYSTMIENSVPYNYLQHLETRKLLVLEGKDAATLLQGLITNDVYQIAQNKLCSMYTMFMNSKGRVICDAIIYSMGNEDSYLVECDAAIQQKLLKHLKMYKLRRAVNINTMESQVFALYDPAQALEGSVETAKHLSLLERPLENGAGTIVNNLSLFSDPRTKCLGYRIIGSEILTAPKELQVAKINPEANDYNYRWFRYSLGVGEGVVDIPPDNAFPFEHNCDYLNGINFHKGCYLGQELTARTYHTGVTRKRLMPVTLEKLEKFPQEINLQNDEQKPVGKLRGIEQKIALALLRMHLVAEQKIKIGTTTGIAKIPHWWPKEKTKIMDNVNENITGNHCDTKDDPAQVEKKMFECTCCGLREEYEYFGQEPPYNKRYKLNEPSFVIEDPFQQPKLGEFLILGTYCKECKKAICKNPQCSFYYEHTFCVPCARNKKFLFPPAIQDKLNKVPY